MNQISSPFHIDVYNNIYRWYNKPHQSLSKVTCVFVVETENAIEIHQQCDRSEGAVSIVALTRSTLYRGASDLLLVLVFSK